MSQQEAALQSVQFMLGSMQTLQQQLAACPDRAILTAVRHAQQRLDESAMLLSLVSGGGVKLHPNVHPLAHHINVGDDMARLLLDQDLDFSQLDESQIDELTNTLTTAEAAYQQFRVLSTLAMLHMSQALTLHDSAVKRQQDLAAKASTGGNQQ